MWSALFDPPPAEEKIYLTTLTQINLILNCNNKIVNININSYKKYFPFF